MIGLAALVTAGLTLVSGFGLGTLLLPLFALFFPLEVAVAVTAIVHGANNAFKIALVGRQADRSLVLTFGLPAILAALAGASALSYMSHFGELLSYSLGPRVAVITPLKLVMAGLMLAFALLELSPRLRSFEFGREHLILGGLLSGFFGGLSGHQGALRSAFLVKVGVSAQVFVGTAAVIGFLVDVTRIAGYLFFFLLIGTTRPVEIEQWPLILTGVMAAFLGVLIAKRFLHKIRMSTIQTLTGVLLLGIALALGLGVV